MSIRTEKEAFGTKQRLLETAVRLFLRHGYDGVSIRDLTEAAAANVASINYHFGGKENLYKEVFRQLIGDRAEGTLSAMRRAAAEDDPPVVRKVLTEYVAGFFKGAMDASHAGRGLVRMLANEISEDGKATDVLLDVVVMPAHKILRAAIRKAHPDIDEDRMILSVISTSGQVFHFIRARALVTRLTGKDYSPEFVSQVVEHIIEFSLLGLQSAIKK